MDDETPESVTGRATGGIHLTIELVESFQVDGVVKKAKCRLQGHGYKWAHIHSQKHGTDINFMVCGVCGHVRYKSNEQYLPSH